jgi:8-oxo-dGTP pyrophosphatase MutT (NUDIX family)
VALVFTPEYDLLFMTRAAHEGDPWSGHISFPGGHMEASDSSALHAAIRETQEELGLTLREDQCLGPLHQVQTPPAPDLIVHPFVFKLDSVPELRLEPSEVQRAHFIPLESLLNGEHRGDFMFQFKEHNLRLPCVYFGEERLWGLTLRIVDDLLNRMDGKGLGHERRPQ